MADGDLSIPTDYPTRIKQFRARLGLTQAELAARLGVSFATVNRWENGQTKPSPLSWQQLVRIDEGDAPAVTEEQAPIAPPILDFTGSPQVVRTIAEGERLSFGHMFNPVFATEISQIDPLTDLPRADQNSDRRHQRRALTEAELLRLLKTARLRPLAEYGREVVARKPSAKRSRRCRATWTRGPLTYEGLDAAAERARAALQANPDLVAELERIGR